MSSRVLHGLGVVNTQVPGTNVLKTVIIVWVVVSLLFLVISLIAWAKIVSKAGYSGWWVLIIFVPFLGALVALVMFFVFAFSEWPIERQLAAARSRIGGGGYGPPPGSVPQWTPSPSPASGSPVSGYQVSGYAAGGYPPGVGPQGADTTPGVVTEGGDEPPRSRYLPRPGTPPAGGAPPPPPAPPPAGGMA